MLHSLVISLVYFRDVSATDKIVLGGALRIPLKYHTYMSVHLGAVHVDDILDEHKCRSSSRLLYTMEMGL